jgi:large conductance mechanosensitive channel
MLKNFWSELKKFALRGNLVDLAIGFTVGAAFTTIAKSLVSDIIMPPIGLMLGSADFSDLFLLLRAGAESPPPYVTLGDAQAAGAVTLNYGLFINNLLTFVLVTLVMFALIRVFNRLDDQLEDQFGSDKQQPAEPVNKKCPYCRTVIAYKATRCPACTSQLDE